MFNVSDKVRFIGSKQTWVVNGISPVDDRFVSLRSVDGRTNLRGLINVRELVSVK